MKKFFSTLAGLIAGTSLSATAQAGVCADDAALTKAFKYRVEISFDEMTDMRNGFKAIFDAATSTADKIECATYIGRTDIVRGALLPILEHVPKDNQKQALDDCLSIAKAIRYTNSAEYHYFHLTCLSFRGKLEGIMGIIKYGLMVRESKGPALEVARNGGNFEAGGIFRVISALSGNRKAIPLGLYDSEEAAQFANFALATPERNLPPFSSPLSGDSFYENHYYKGQALLVLGIDRNQKDKAEEGNRILKYKIEEIDFLAAIDDLGERSLETLAYQELMKKLKEKADSCLSRTDWIHCLIDRLSE